MPCACILSAPAATVTNFRVRPLNLMYFRECKAPTFILKKIKAARHHGMAHALATIWVW